MIWSHSILWCSWAAHNEWRSSKVTESDVIKASVSQTQWTSGFCWNWKQEKRVTCLCWNDNTCCDLMKHLFSQHLWICPVKPTLRATENKNCDICNCITGGTHRTLWDSIKLNTDISDWIAAKLDFWLPKKTRNVISFHPENTEKISSVNNKPMHV